MITTVDPLAPRVVRYEFERLVPVSEWMELVNGKPVTRYSNKPPESGAYELVTRR